MSPQQADSGAKPVVGLSIGTLYRRTDGTRPTSEAMSRHN